MLHAGPGGRGRIIPSPVGWRRPYCRLQLRGGKRLPVSKRTRDMLEKSVAAFHGAQSAAVRNPGRCKALMSKAVKQAQTSSRNSAAELL